MQLGQSFTVVFSFALFPLDVSPQASTAFNYICISPDDAATIILHSSEQSELLWRAEESEEKFNVKINTFC